jgi:hypothetical protein
MYLKKSTFAPIIMRTVAEIPHHTYKISVFSYNAKFIVKIELGQFEQIYKINEMDVMGLEDVKNMLTPAFLENCMDRFLTMREDWHKSFTEKQSLNS